MHDPDQASLPSDSSEGPGLSDSDLCFARRFDLPETEDGIREAKENLLGFFRVLLRWDANERSEADGDTP